MNERPLIETDVVKAREVAKEVARRMRPIRSERTLRMMAKEFAAAWWDESVKLGEREYLTREEKEFAQKRSAIFRLTWPDQRVYVALCWPMFYKQAREQAISMLAEGSTTTSLMKERIYDALIEDREKQDAARGAPIRRIIA